MKPPHPRSSLVADVVVEDEKDSPLPLSRHRARATWEAGLEQLQGSGCGSTPETARMIAAMECLERVAQFTRVPPDDVVESRLADLPGAVSPQQLGPYSRRQYGVPGFPCRPFDPCSIYRWVPLRSGCDDEVTYVPCEFVYPRLRGADGLVCATSSGTAAAHTLDQAVTAAILEVVERDALLRWWYRQEEATVLNVSPLAEDLRRDLSALIDLGLLVTAARLPAAAELPCIVVCAERGRAFHLGSACALTPLAALEHALREVSQSIAAWGFRDETGWPLMTPSQIVTPTDHHRCYLSEPWATVRRNFFARTLRPARDGPEANAWWQMPAPSVERLVEHLSQAGHPVLLRTLQAPGNGFPAYVTHVLAPTLVPHHIGFNRERFGHRRLSALGEDGSRLRTMLPHPFS